MTKRTGGVCTARKNPMISGKPPEVEHEGARCVANDPRGVTLYICDFCKCVFEPDEESEGT